MEIVLIGGCVVCILGVLHTYVLYPCYVLHRAGKRRCKPTPESSQPIGWPEVHLLMAVHNEELVLPEKLASLAAQDYAGRLTVLIGSDGSTDATEAILDDFSLYGAGRQYRWSANPRRSGKPATINRLAAEAGGSGVFIMTDASVILRSDTVTELVRPLLHDASLGVVDSRLLHTGVGGKSGIGAAENTYITTEVALKQAESDCFGYPIGPFGGCWALRAEAFVPVPDAFLVDDFFLCMSAYRRGWRGHSSRRAVVYEGVGQRLADEFRRKVRIGSGSWQNMLYFHDLWWPPWRGWLAFALFSHKVLRWVTPLLLSVAAASLLGLWWGTGNYWAGVMLGMTTAVPILSLLLEPLLRRLGIRMSLLKNLNYLMAMNLALLVGFVRFLNGIKSNVWQPSYRHQDDRPGRDTP